MSVELDPRVIRFAHSRVRPCFTGCGSRIEDTMQQILAGQLSVADLPLITVIEIAPSEADGGTRAYVSLNNRRLYLFKRLQDLGALPGDVVPVRVKAALPREREKYTIERCSLHARLMKEHTPGTNRDADENETCDFDESEADLHVSSVTGSDEGRSSGQADIASMSTGARPTDKPRKQQQPQQQIQVQPLPAALVRNDITQLQKLVAKGKAKQALSKIDELCEEYNLTDPQRTEMCKLAGLTKY